MRFILLQNHIFSCSARFRKFSSKTKIPEKLLERKRERWRHREEVYATWNM